MQIFMKNLLNSRYEQQSLSIPNLYSKISYFIQCLIFNLCNLDLMNNKNVHFYEKDDYI